VILREVIEANGLNLDDDVFLIAATRKDAPEQLEVHANVPPDICGELAQTITDILTRMAQTCGH
jgi:hypothetical protein